MQENKKLFKKLLTINELFSVYCKISETLITEIDINNSGYDKESMANSIDLLIKLGFISYNKDEEMFIKEESQTLMFDEFSDKLYLKLLREAPVIYETINQAHLLYDENRRQYYIKRNSFKLDYSALIMLLNGLGKIETTKYDVYILDITLLKYRKEHSERGNVKTLSELKAEIIRNEELGRLAELIALKYEKDLLSKINVNKLPEMISDYNVSAGYDIVSYMSEESETYDKFIEVKSCSDGRYIFYISKNEIETADKKRDNYFLYLYNRMDGNFKVIQNPYYYLFHSKMSVEWRKDPQIFKIELI